MGKMKGVAGATSAMHAMRSGKQATSSANANRTAAECPRPGADKTQAKPDASAGAQNGEAA